MGLVGGRNQQQLDALMQYPEFQLALLRASRLNNPAALTQSGLVALVVAIPLLLGGAWWLLQRRKVVQP